MRLASMAIVLGLAACGAPATNLPSSDANAVREAESAVAERGADCRDQQTTLDMGVCGNLALVLEQARMDRFLSLALARRVEGDDSLTASQVAWLAYRDAECSAFAKEFEGGSIQGVMSAGCATQLTHERSLVIWNHHLQYADSTPPPVPEPVETVFEERYGD